MDTVISWTILGLFGVATLALAAYGIHLYVLVFLFRRRRDDRRDRQQAVIERYRAATPEADWPVVTSQIPLYNESNVCDRVIRAVAVMDYPAGRHEVQVLDDSTDETRRIVDQTVASLRAEGMDVRVLRRRQRDGFKAGALAVGVEASRGDFLAVFDADFVPPADFLRRAVPLLVDAPDLACLQGRWSHLNQNESWLTRAQALGIDGHFAIEQGARAWNGLMMNFNGTAGVWRKAAIEDPAVGGWNGDTLTEDLDLSYRAQLAGWRLDYCLDLACPAELPGDIQALKSQQRRWATGSIQVARKLLPRIWRAPVGLGEKVEATLHLTHYSVAVWMLILAVVARPMLFAFSDGHVFEAWFWAAWLVILASAVAPSLTYTYARYSLGGRWSGFATIPWMLVLGCGLCLNNAMAVVRGLSRRRAEFVRTPKTGGTRRPARRRYLLETNRMWLVEIALGVYSLFCFVVYVNHIYRGFSVFLLIYAMGFLTVGTLSSPFAGVFRRSVPSADQARPSAEPLRAATVVQDVAGPRASVSAAMRGSRRETSFAGESASSESPVSSAP